MRVRQVFSNVVLRDVLLAYCATIWRDGWKKGKTEAKQDAGDPFVGGPMDLVALGITEVAKPDGTVVKLSPLTRLRVRDLSNASLRAISEVTGKDLLAIRTALGNNADGKDVVHQEYVATFEENVDNDPKHLLNNLVAASAVIDFVVSFVANDDTSVDELADILDATIGGQNEEIAVLLSMADRASWLGRACQDGSWKDSRDFAFYQNLEKNAAALDTYVVVPILKMFVQDLRDGKFENS